MKNNRKPPALLVRRAPLGHGPEAPAYFTRAEPVKAPVPMKDWLARHKEAA